MDVFSNSSRTKAFLKDCRGAAVIEFILVAPILLSLVLGTIEFGRYLQAHHMLIKSARDSSRFLSRIEMKCSGTNTFCCPSTDASWAIAEIDAKNLALRGSIDPTSAFVTNAWTDPTTISFSVTCLDNSSGAFRGQSYIPTITTTISMPYTQVGFLSFLGVGPLMLTVIHEEVNFGE